MKPTKQNIIGFTLVELLLYISISSILLVSIGSYIVMLSQLNNQREVAEGIQSQITHIHDTLSYQIRIASNIISPNVGSESDTLVLDMKDVSMGQSVISMQDGVLMLNADSHGELPLTSQPLTVTDSSFTNTSGDGTEGNLYYQISVSWTDEKQEVQTDVLEGSLNLR